MTVTFWGRRGDPETVDAQAFLRRHGYRADKVRDLDQDPPLGAELDAVMRSAGAGAADPQTVPPPEADLALWLVAEPRRLRAPILLTPRGALVGFREHRWREFLDIGKGRA